MKPSDIIRHYGTQVEAAAALGVAQSTISGWVTSGKVPALRQMQAQRLTRGRLKVDAAAMAKLRAAGLA
jgi:hypothetical protein